MSNVYFKKETASKVGKFSPIQKTEKHHPTTDQNPRFWNWLLFAMILIVVGIALLMSNSERVPVTVIDEEGNVVLAPERAAKLAKELEELDEAEQYVLLATASRHYPCYSCPGGQKTIYLHAGEVWRYGTTRKGEQGRYPDQDYGAPFLTYVPQFWGTLSDCIKQEKIKIYNYPLLPQAMAREIQLIRPPGNKNDN